MKVNKTKELDIKLKNIIVHKGKPIELPKGTTIIGQIHRRI